MIAPVFLLVPADRCYRPGEALDSAGGYELHAAPSDAERRERLVVRFAQPIRGPL